MWIVLHVQILNLSFTHIMIQIQLLDSPSYLDVFIRLQTEIPLK